MNSHCTFTKDPTKVTNFNSPYTTQSHTSQKGTNLGLNMTNDLDVLINN